MPVLGSLGFVTVPTPGTPVPLSATKLLVRHLRLQPRAAATTVNVGNTYVIIPGGGGKGTATSIHAVLTPEQVEGKDFLSSNDTSLIDLSQVLIDADNASDGFLVGYSQ
jgi:hypothetical protein